MQSCFPQRVHTPHEFRQYVDKHFKILIAVNLLLGVLYLEQVLAGLQYIIVINSF